MWLCPFMTWLRMVMTHCCLTRFVLVAGCRWFVTPLCVVLEWHGLTEETLRWWLDQEWFDLIGWTGSSAQTVPCGPSHHRCMQCFCVVCYWLLPVNQDMTIVTMYSTGVQIVACISGTCSCHYPFICLVWWQLWWRRPLPVLACWKIVAGSERDMAYATMLVRFVYFITGTAVGRDVMDRDIVLFIVLFIIIYVVYCIMFRAPMRDCVV